MGSVVISLDAELAWGFHHLDDLPEARIRDGRRAWRRLLALFDEYDVPATWAVTGHLFRRECDERHRGHPADERLCAVDGETLPAEELWFGDGLVDAVASARVDHELAWHGHTHVHFNHEAMTREFARRELRGGVEAAADRGVDLDTAVFPVNEIAHRDLLVEQGFGAYRGGGPERRLGENRRRLRKLARGTTGRPAPPLVEPRVDEYGLVNVPASLYLYGLDGPVRSALAALGRDVVYQQAAGGVDRAATGDGVFHAWLHPHNVHRDADVAALRRLLERIERRRASDDLRVETMGAVAARTRRNAGE